MHISRSDGEQDIQRAIKTCPAESVFWGVGNTDATRGSKEIPRCKSMQKARLCGNGQSAS